MHADNPSVLLIDIGLRTVCKVFPGAVGDGEGHIACFSILVHKRLHEPVGRFGDGYLFRSSEIAGSIHDYRITLVHPVEHQGSRFHIYSCPIDLKSPRPVIGRHQAVCPLRSADGGKSEQTACLVFVPSLIPVAVVCCQCHGAEQLDTECRALGVFETEFSPFLEVGAGAEIHCKIMYRPQSCYSLIHQHSFIVIRIEEIFRMSVSN